MPRGSIKIRYTARVTRRVRVTTRVRYSARVEATVRYVVTEARARGIPLYEDARDELLSEVHALLPAGIDEDEVLDAIDATCEELEGE